MEKELGEMIHPSNDSRIAATGELKVGYHFDESAGALKSIDVFTLTINTFVFAAQNGLDSRVAEFIEWSAFLGHTTIKVTADENRYGNVQLRNGHVRTAMKRIIEVMVARKKFVAMDMVLSIDDVIIARGPVYQAKRESLTMPIGSEESVV